MNSSKMFTTMQSVRATIAQAAVPSASIWLEWIVLPLALSFMDAQPIGIALAMLTFFATQTPNGEILSTGEIALLLLGLLWWAMGIAYLSSKRLAMPGFLYAFLQLLGWGGAVVVVIFPHFAALIHGNDLATTLVASLLVTWFWRRGLQRARHGWEYTSLSRSFKIGLGVLLFLMLVAMIMPHGPIFLRMLVGSLTTFFLSGLIVLSLARLSTVRRARRQDGSQADPTRVWVLALTILSCLIIACTLVLETLFSFVPFAFLLAIMASLWDGLSMLLIWLLTALFWLIFTPIFSLLSWLFAHLSTQTSSQSQPLSLPKPLQAPQSPHSLSPEILTVGRWVLLGLIVCAVLLVIRITLRHWRRKSGEEGEEETRETLDAQTLLQERWRSWWRQRKRRKQAILAALDPRSARARYRELLQTIATKKPDLARKESETPIEYKRRLRAQVVPAESMDGVLDELTHSYMQERYGEISTDEQTRAHLQTRVPYLIKQLTGRVSGTKEIRKRSKSAR